MNNATNINKISYFGEEVSKMHWRDMIISHINHNIDDWPARGEKIIRSIDSSNIPDFEAHLVLGSINKYKMYLDLDELMVDINY